MTDGVAPQPAAPAATIRDRESAVVTGLIQHWAGAIRTAAARYRLGAADVDELTQDIRLRLWRLLERHGPDHEIRGGLVYRAAINAAIDLVRRQRTDRHVSLEVLQDEAALRSRETDEPELLAALERALDALPLSRRPAVRLHLSGRSIEEIATVMGWSLGKARNLVYRGLADLRRSLEEANARG